MRKIFVLFLLLPPISFLQLAYGQKFLNLKEASLVHPDSVEYLKIPRQKLTELPKEIWKFKNLKGLDVSKNRLKTVPDSLDKLGQLESLNFRKNRLTLFPEIYGLHRLKKLNLSSNFIGEIPDSIYLCVDLQVLDLYNNPISDLGNGLSSLKKLELIDLRGIMMNSKKQKEISKSYQGIQILFDAPCNCVD